MATRYSLARAKVLADTLDDATTKYLLTNKSPSRRVNELDNRGSHFYLALYWAQALSEQADDPELASQFGDIAQQLADNESTIVTELEDAQGEEVNLNGYYMPDDTLAAQAMRPSQTLNAIIASM